MTKHSKKHRDALAALKADPRFKPSPEQRQGQTLVILPGNPAKK